MLVQKIKNILFSSLLFLLILPSYGNINQNESFSLRSEDNNLFCNTWTLLRITVVSEKVIYEDSGNVTLTFNCQENTWTIKEGNSLLSSGTWMLNSSMLELKEQGEVQLGGITQLSKQRLTISYSDIIQEYVR